MARESWAGKPARIGQFLRLNLDSIQCGLGVANSTGCGRPRRLPLRTGVGEGIGEDSVGGVPLWVAVGEGGGRSGGIGFLLTEAGRWKYPG